MTPGTRLHLRNVPGEISLSISIVSMSRRRWARRAGIALGVVLVVSFVGFQIPEPGWRYEVSGVDVSHHQGQIDWDALSADGTTVAYIKATEGGDWTDDRFSVNWEEADDAGVLRGAFHFFTLCTPGVDQAEHMIATVPDQPRNAAPSRGSRVWW